MVAVLQDPATSGQLRFASAELRLFSNPVRRLNFTVHLHQLNAHTIMSIQVGSVISWSQHVVHVVGHPDDFTKINQIQVKSCRCIRRMEEAAINLFMQSRLQCCA
jgi:hypothetical protein